MKQLFYLFAVVAVFGLVGCSKESEDLSSKITPLSEYAPLQVGKYITYQLDSLQFTNFGTTEEVYTYQVKLAVEDSFVDNLQRKAFKIVRYIRQSNAQSWYSDNTFFAVNTGSSFEFVENNMRFLKLSLPINNGHSWKGNSFIDTYSTNSPDIRYLNDWDYYYDSVGTALTIPNFTLSNTIKVNQRDEVIGNPADPNSYSEINFSSENYALGLGLVYRKFLHQEYQPPTPGTGGYKLGYGVTMTMIDHN